MNDKTPSIRQQLLDYLYTPESTDCAATIPKIAEDLGLTIKQVESAAYQMRMAVTQQGNTLKLAEPAIPFIHGKKAAGEAYKISDLLHYCDPEAFKLSQASKSKAAKRAYRKKTAKPQTNTDSTSKDLDDLLDGLAKYAGKTEQYRQCLISIRDQINEVLEDA